MHITITGHHVDITESIRDAINSRLGKLHNHFPDIASLAVIVTVEKKQQTAEVSSHYLGQDLTAKASSEDLYQAISEMASKLSSLMKRQKEKIKSHPHDKLQLKEAVTDTEDEIEAEY